MESLLPLLPSIRDDLKVIQSDQKYLIEDVLLRQKVRLDSLSKEIIDRLSDSKDINDLVLSHGVDPVYRRVVFLAQRGFMKGLRYEQNLKAVSDQSDVSETLDEGVVLTFEEGLKHACQACGSCCSATDVGPISKDHVDAILKHDWRAEISELESNDSVFRFEHMGKESIALTAMRNDRCIFLDSDSLCLVHKKLGAGAKPTPCRQFPYQFAKVSNQIFVSLQMECRAYWKANQSAEPTSQKSDELYGLINEGAPVHPSPDVISVDPGLQISAQDYLKLEERIISAVRKAPMQPSGTAPIAAYLQVVDEILTELYADIDAEEDYRNRENWPEPHSDLDIWESFLNVVGSFENEVSDFCGEASKVATERSLNALADRFNRLKQSTLAACSQVDPQTFSYQDPEAVHSIISDLIVSALFGKETLRRSDIRYGFARIGLRVWFTLAGACQLAKEACRTHIVTQDVIDSMVTMSKMLRERAIEELFEGQKSSIISVFLTNLGVFLKLTPPRRDGPGGIG